MTGQQLKNSILQEAIQGRLVPNVLEPGEKAGAALLQDILAERQKKETSEKGKKAKKLTLSTIEEEPWELPGGWCWAHISDIFDHSAGKSLNSSRQSIGRIYPYLTTSNVYWEGISFEKVKEMAFTEEEYKKCSAIKNDILVCEGGDVGRSCIWTYDYSIGLQNHVHRLRSIKSTDVEFFNYVLRFYKASGIITAKGIGIGGFSANALKGLPVPLPPLSIQKAIVAKIEELFPLIDEYDKAAVELETLNKILPDKLRKSVLQEAIHGTLVSNDIPEGEATASELLQQVLKERQERENKEKGKKAKKITLSTIEEEPWELPEGWCWCKIDDIAFVTKLAGFEYSKYIAPNLVSSGVPLFKGKNVQNGVIDYTFESYIPQDVSNSLWRSKLSKKCILTPYVGTIGNVAIFDARIEAHLGSNVGKIELDNDTILNEFIVYYLRCEDGLNQLKKHKKATAQESISIEAIRDVYVPLPPLSIQHRIVEKIEEVFSVIDKLQA